MDYLKVEGRNWPAHDGEVKVLFGLDRKAKWPKDGMVAKELQGIWCYVLGLDAARARGITLRALCKCPNCGKHMPIGRLAQHWRTVHKA